MWSIDSSFKEVNLAFVRTSSQNIAANCINVTVFLSVFMYINPAYDVYFSKNESPVTRHYKPDHNKVIQS